jgi:ribosome-associated translation inhibitor RaiA
MHAPIQIVFHRMESSAAVEADVRRRLAKLEGASSRITSCRVAIEAPHRRHQQGRIFQVRVEIHVPGGHIVTGRSSDEHHAHEDVYVAVRDAFRAARRRLEDHARRRRDRLRGGSEAPPGFDLGPPG